MQECPLRISCRMFRCTFKANIVHCTLLSAANSSYHSQGVLLPNESVKMVHIRILTLKLQMEFSHSTGHIIRLPFSFNVFGSRRGGQHIQCDSLFHDKYVVNK